MNLQSRYLALAEFLAAHRRLWDLVAFHEREIVWRDAYPGLAGAFDKLTETELQRLRGDPSTAFDLVSTCVPSLRALPDLLQLPKVPAATIVPEHAASFRAVRSHKRAQITAFLEHLPDFSTRTDVRVVEWCAGKAHLLRALTTASINERVAIDINADLLHEAMLLAERDKIGLRTLCCDVLAPEISQYDLAGHHVLALHACGELHRPLLERARERHFASIHLAPCCYNRLFGRVYCDYSSLAKSHSLGLNTDHLRACLQAFGRADRSTIAAREQEDLWRLAFDEMARDVTGSKFYISTRARPRSYECESLEAFCRAQSAAKGIGFPSTFSQSTWLLRAQARLQVLWRLGVVARIFQRPLELLLCCDRACYLEECGYETTLSEFCPPSVTLRNLLICART